MSRSVSKQSTMHPQRTVCVWGTAFGIALVIAAAGSTAALAQTTSRGSGSNTVNQPPPVMMPNLDPLDRPPIYDGSGEGDPMRAQAEQRRIQAMNVDRQKSMVADTNRLVKMAADLNAQINSEQRSQLTPVQERQLADIEKLAHSIREKMSTAVNGNSPMMGSPMMLPPR